MAATFNIKLFTGDKAMILTWEGFRPLSRDAYDFETESDPRAAFDAIDAAWLCQDGFKGYHNISVWLTKNTRRFGSVKNKTISEKNIVVMDKIA